MKRYATLLFFLSSFMTSFAWSQEIPAPQSKTTLKEEKAEQSTENKTEEKAEQSAENKNEEKAEKSAENKNEEKAEKSTENKNEEQVEESTEDRAEEKDEETTEEKTGKTLEEESSAASTRFSSAQELQLWREALQVRKQRNYQRISHLFTSDIAEVVLLSAAEMMGLVILGEAALLTSDLSISSDLSPVFILSPLLGGVLGGYASQKILTSVGEDFRGGSLDLVRGSFFLGAVNGIGAVMLLDSLNLQGFESYTESGPIMAGLGSMATLGTAIGIGLLAPVKNPSAGAVGISGGMTAATLTLLMNAAFDNPLRENMGYGLIAASNIGFAAGVTLSQFVPIRRLDTWMWDLGGLLGGWTALTLATNLNAPNPIIGWGSTSLGVLLGGAGGYALSQWLIADQKPGIAKLMQKISVAPLVVQNLKNEKPASGMQLKFAF